MSALNFRWSVPPTKPALSPGAVHVWCVPLDLQPSRIEHRFTRLSPDERNRAGRFHFDRDRRRFIARRGALRAILADYVNVPPGHLQFQYSEKGKPALDGPPGCSGIQFNLTTSQEMALVAVGQDREVGVDVEHLRPLPDADPLTARHFSPWERQELKRLPPGDRLAGFFNGWTRKEAMLKAIGTGLSFPLERMEVSLPPDEPARLLSLDGDTAAARQWSLCSFEPAPGFIAALAARPALGQICYWMLL